MRKAALHEMRYRLGGFALVWMLLCTIFFSAAAETRIEMTPGEDWSWEAGTISSFSGTVLPDQDIKDATLTLRVETKLESSGEAVFTVVDGKKLKIRKRAATVTEDLSAGREIAFEAEWNLPEEMEESIAHALIHLEIQDGDGNVIASSAMEAGSREEESKTAASPVQKADQLILYLAIACAVVWALAVARHLILNRKKVITYKF